MLKTALLVAAVVSIAMSTPLMIPAYAQNVQEAEILGYHQMCDKGNRQACVKFGMMIEHNRDMQAEWRMRHPEWFWWEH